MMAGWGALAASGLLLLAAVASGTGILRILGARPHAGEALLYALVLGLGLQGTLLLACAALGWMSPIALWAAVAVPALGGAGTLATLRRAWSAAREALDTLTAVERIALVIVGGVVLVVLFVGAMGPVMDWDSQMYHVRLPVQFLAEGRLYLPDDGNHLAFLGLFQFLYLPLLAIGGDAGPALLNGAMTALLGATLAVVGHRAFGTRTGVLAAIAVWGSSALLLVGATPRVDVSLTTVLVVTHLAVLRCFDDDGDWALPVAALCAGVAVAMKYHALPYVGILLPFALWATWRRDGQAATTARAGAVALALAAVVIVPWLVKNIYYFGAPFYPFGTAKRLMPFLAQITGSFAIPAVVPPAALDAIGRAREPISLAGLLFRPAALSVEVEAVAYTRNVLFALVPLTALYWRDRRLLILAIPALAYLGFTLGWFARTNLRYLIPALPLLTLCAVEVLRRLAARWPGERPAAAVLAAIAVLAAAPGLRAASREIVSIPRAQVALGLWDRETLLLQQVPYVAAQLVEERTPPDARILMLFESRGLYFTRTVLQDNLLTNWPVLHYTGATARCLAGTGITHVLLNQPAPGYYQSRGADLAVMGWPSFPEFAQRCLLPIGQVRTMMLFRVR